MSKGLVEIVLFLLSTWRSWSSNLCLVNGLLVAGSQKSRFGSSSLIVGSTLIPSSEDAHQEENDVFVGDAKMRLKPLVDAIQNATLDDNNVQRFFHGRGGMFPGCEHLTLDLFPPVCLLTSHLIELQPDELDVIGTALEERLSKIREGRSDNDENLELNWIYQHRPKGTLPATTTLLKGQGPPDKHFVVENGMKFYVRLLHAQNHGLFVDMANGRNWVKQNSLNKNVLNLFAYTCGFSVAALLGGASQVINIDMAKGPLKLGQQNHDLNGLVGQEQAARFLPHDIFKSWGKIKRLGPYDMIIADPPSFQRKSFVATKDYIKLIRRLPDLLSPDGVAVLCLNAPELGTEWLKEQVVMAAPSLSYVDRIANPSTFPAKDVERSLKVIVYQKKEQLTK